MKVAVVTPYYRESDDILKRCLDSVACQAGEVAHVLVADGFPNPLADRYPKAVHLKLPRAHADNGDTPRGIGGKWALDNDFQAIAFLDADNWYYPDHIACMTDLLASSRAPVLVAGRSIHRKDGSVFAGLKELGDGVHYTDTSCLFLSGPALWMAPLWAAIPTRLSPICDRIFWQMLMAQGYPVAKSERITVAFVSQYVAHYEAAGEQPPPGSKDGSELAEAVTWWNALPPEEQARLSRIMGFP